MTPVLIDHNLELEAERLAGVVDHTGMASLAPMSFVVFRDVGLAENATDRTVWRFAQTRRMVLLTANRNMPGADSLELTLREELNSRSLPVVTVASQHRLSDPRYREACAYRLIEIVQELSQYSGIGRVFIP